MNESKPFRMPTPEEVRAFLGNLTHEEVEDIRRRAAESLRLAESRAKDLLEKTRVTPEQLEARFTI